ncbi:MAG: type II toxin-antitoxin system RelE/ParE family toxin [Candidatus Symbiobacter sp.]|nr:type II toxin-antitoxin system RelE/ParE family toxin [Candidatus Symbiobacter sp.]
MSWSVNFLNDRIKSQLDAQPADIQARFYRIVELIEQAGLEQVHEPYVKHIEGPLWEMRMKGKDGIARAFYVTKSSYRVIVVHVFSKKTQKTPRREINTALKRYKEMTNG